MPWKPGESGNPGGQPKAGKMLRELARQHTEDALRTLLSVMGDPEAPPASRVSAAQAVLDRGWGKPPQEITGADGGAIRTESVVRYDLTGLSADELQQMQALLEKTSAASVH